MDKDLIKALQDITEQLQTLNDYVAMLTKPITQGQEVKDTITLYESEQMELWVLLTTDKEHSEKCQHLMNKYGIDPDDICNFVYDMMRKQNAKLDLNMQYTDRPI